MILVFGGTTEGRACARVLDEAGTPFFYSTRGSLQHVESTSGIRVTGGMDRMEMTEFCADHDIRLMVDAAHPFASELHATVAEVSAACGIPVVRYERTFPPLTPDDIACDDYADAVLKLRRDGVRRLLALTGVKTITSLKDFWQTAGTGGCFFRILDRDESFLMARRAGFPAQNLLLYDDGRSISQLISDIRPDAIITKESGETGGFEEKRQAASAAGIPLYVVRRPALPGGFVTVTGPHGLRRMVERLAPGFFALRTGFTTGSCATAAARAALMSLLGITGRGTSVTSFILPDGEEMKMETTVGEVTPSYAEASAIKDAGDDPDVINGHEIRVRVAYASPRSEQFRFIGGRGIGTVTLPGLDIPVGGPAINSTPRRMIKANLSPLYDGPLDITISIPDGEELAKKTFNPKIGIVGGLSVIGTSGIVKPFSAQAFADAVKREMEVAVAMGGGTVVMNSGARSEGYMKKEFPSLPPQAFVHYGNFIGGCLAGARDLGVPRVILGSMLGKAVKLAAGHLDTHSHNVVMDRDFLRSTAAAAGCSGRASEIIGGINLARELWTALPPDDAARFFAAIARLCAASCRKVYDSGSFTFMLIDEEGNIRQRINA